MSAGEAIVTSINRAGGATEPVLPSSRRPVPGSEEYRRQAAAEAAARNGARRDGSASAADIEAGLDATTERLAASIDELVNRLSPDRLAARSVSRVRTLVVTPSGRPRAEVVGAAVGALIGVAVLVWRSRRR
jgi:Protein of unknown function (DUF3618)